MGKIAEAIIGMLIRVARDDWQIGLAITYEDWAKGKKGFVNYTEKEIIELIEREVIPSEANFYPMWVGCIKATKQNLAKLKED